MASASSARISLGGLAWLSGLLVGLAVCGCDDRPAPLQRATTSLLSSASSAAGALVRRPGHRERQPLANLTPRRPDDWPKPGLYQRTLSFAGVTRSYGLAVPRAYNDRDPRPLLLALHSEAGRVDALLAAEPGVVLGAERAGYVVVIPAGSPTSNTSEDDRGQSWDHGLCPPPKRPPGNDGAFLVRLIEQLRSELKLDPQRIYGIGIAEGGTMLQRLASSANTPFRAIATIGASVGCKPAAGVAQRLPAATKPTSVMWLHGRNDKTAPLGGGPMQLHSGRHGIEALPAQALTDHWHALNRCNAKPVVEGSPETAFQRSRYDCRPTHTEIVALIMNQSDGSLPRRLGSRTPMDTIARFFDRQR